MKATDLIKILQGLVETNGDHDIVVGIERTGYGEPIENITFVSTVRGKNIVDLDGNPASVISLVASDESTHTVGGW